MTLRGSAVSPSQAPQVLGQPRPQARRQHDDAALVSLAAPHDHLSSIEVDVACP